MALYLGDKKIAGNYKINQDDLIDIYSTAEIKTNKLWVDGKIVYRKSFTFTSTAIISTGITNIDNLVKFECLIKASNTKDGSWRSLPWLFGNTASWMGGVFLRPDGEIRFQLGADLNEIEKGVIILEYTKNEVTV